MESSSPINSLSFEVKCDHIFKIAISPIEMIESTKICLPVSLFRFTISCFLLAVIFLFSWQKKSSTGPISGEYWGKYIHDRFACINQLRTSPDYCTDQLSKIKQISSSFIPIIFCIFLINLWCIQRKCMFWLFPI